MLSLPLYTLKLFVLVKINTNILTDAVKNSKMMECVNNVWFQ